MQANIKQVNNNNAINVLFIHVKDKHVHMVSHLQGFMDTINAWFNVDYDDHFFKSSCILPARLKTPSHATLVAGCARN
jgi:hypothetical protein